MEDGSRRGSAGSAELPAANANQQNGEGTVEASTRESVAGPGRPAPAAQMMERRNSAPQGCYQRHMPLEVLKMPIPRKTREKRGKATAANTPRLTVVYVCVDGRSAPQNGYRL